MTAPAVESPTSSGPIAAALFSAGLGCFFVGFTNVLAAISKPLTRAFSVYAPSGALSGEALLSVLIWLAAWAILARRWRTSTAPFTRTILAAYVLLFLGLLMTFPPIVHILAAI